MLEQFRLFSEYNQHMNQRLYAAAAQLSDDDLSRDRGAFFKSVIATLNHIVVGDIIWLKRFSTQPAGAYLLSHTSQLPQPHALNAMLYDNLETLRPAREEIDQLIIQWINNLSEWELAEPILYKNMAGMHFKKPLESLISHLFLHQVHHRGQATTLLSQSGIDFGDTDLIEFISDVTG